MCEILVEFEVPRDWRYFKLPPALDSRLQKLLDRQDREGRISQAERREAQALTQLVDMLSLMKLRAEFSIHGKASKSG